MHFGKLVPVNAHWFCQHNDKLVQRGHIPKEYCNLEKWHWKHLHLQCVWEACLYSRYSKHEAQRQSTPCQLCPSDLQATYEIWITPHWGENVLGFYFLCVWYMWWLSKRETDCLWYYGGMRNHYKSHLFMLPALIHTLSWLDFCICDCNQCHFFSYNCHPPGLVSRFTSQDERK